MIDIEQLLYEEESSTLDFKEEQYHFVGRSVHEKSELLKDILAFANAWRREDSYILIGVKEIKGGKSEIKGITQDDVLDDSSIQQLINDNINKPINFVYKNIKIEDKLIAVIEIPLENNERPFFCKKDYGKVKQNMVYIRRSSSTAIANPDEIMKMAEDKVKIENSPLLILEFADIDNKISLGQNIKFQSEYLKVNDSDNIPDYRSYSYSNDYQLPSSENREYYKQLVDYYIHKNLCSPISFSLYNDSEVLSTDIKVEIKLSGNIVMIKKEKDFPQYSKLYPHDIHNKIEILPDIMIEKRNEIWFIELLFKKVQPKQQVFSKDFIYLAVKDESEFSYTIYADNLPTPQEGILHLMQNITIVELSYKDILKKDKTINLDQLEDKSEIRKVTIDLTKGKQK